MECDSNAPISYFIQALKNYLLQRKLNIAINKCEFMDRLKMN